MPYAILNSDGIIKMVLQKLYPALKLTTGERIVDYILPDFDDNIFKAVANSPVDIKDNKVSFSTEALPTSILWRSIRVKRNGLLSASDWTQLPDVNLQNKELWSIYRKALRDITLQSDPTKLLWPVSP